MKMRTHLLLHATYVLQNLVRMGPLWSTSSNIIVWIQHVRVAEVMLIFFDLQPSAFADFYCYVIDCDLNCACAGVSQNASSNSSSTSKPLKSHKYFCLQCDRTFFCKQKLQKHERSHEEAETEEDAFEALVENYDWQTTSNNVCLSRSNSETTFSSTFETSTPLQFEESSLESESSFAVKTRLPNGGATQKHCYICPIDGCCRTFARKGNLDRHLQLHRAESSRDSSARFKCCECNLTFSKKFNLQRHESLHLPSKIFSCNVCDKSFSNKYYLKHHMASHSEIRKYLCKDCDCVYKTLYGLTQHIRNKH